MYTQKQKPLATRIFLIMLAAGISALNLNSFVKTGGLYPGGFTGLTLLIQEASSRFFHMELPFTPLYLIFNSVPVVISFKFIGKKFTLFSCLMIVVTSFLTDFIPYIPIVEDVILCSVFGGIVNAFASIFCLLAGATAGGTDFISIFISEKYGKDAWNYIFAFNLGILAVAGALFGWEKALYSIVYQYATMQLMQMLYHRYQKVTLIIITSEPETAYEIIKQETNHDATRFEATGCYTKMPKTILYSVISADEAHKISAMVRRADESAFINVIRSDQIVGRFYNRPKD